jgi:hypothetical protein
MMVTLPVVLLASLLLGYWLAQSVRPMEKMVQELEAITDGRSLPSAASPFRRPTTKSPGLASP